MLSHVQLFTTLWTVAHQAPLSTGFSGQGYWSGVVTLSSRGSSNPGIGSDSPAWTGGFFITEPHGKPCSSSLGMAISRLYMSDVRQNNPGQGNGCMKKQSATFN